MYNILLTDDEQIMIDSLSFIINKNFPDQVKIYSSLSGVEALNISLQNKIDIIFMDINMPGLNGLETLKCINQTKPDTVIIILSAFDKFQYAQEAVNLGAYKYLTKPVNRNTVIETVRGAMSLIDKKRGRLTNEVELHKKLDLVSPMVESDFIYSAVFGSGKDVTEYLSYFNITDESCFFLCIEIPHIESKNQYEIYLKIRDILKDKLKCLVGSFMQNRIAVFASCSSSNNAKCLSSEMCSDLQQLYKTLSLKICSGIREGVSGVDSNLQNTSLVYNDAVLALNKVPAEGGIEFYNEQTKNSLHDNKSGKIAEQIFGRIRAGDINNLRPFVDSYINSLVEKFDGNINKIKNSIFELLVNVRNVTTEIDPSYINEAFDNAFLILSKENNMEEIKDFVNIRCGECATDVKRSLSNLENPIVEKACKYIVENISKDLSLEQVAQIVSVSPYYLSKLFKEEKKQNFINYLTDLRIEKACRMLSDSFSSVKEVSAAVGYNDQNYFSRLFKNNVGMSPTEYKDSINHK